MYTWLTTVLDALVICDSVLGELWGRMNTCICVLFVSGPTLGKTVESS